MAGWIRIWLLGAVAALIWALSVPGTPAPLPEDVTPSAFSAARASNVLARLAGFSAPHPVTSAANIAMRQRLIEELRRLGISAATQSGMSCAARRGNVICAPVTNVMAQVGAGSGQAVLLVAHYDSVAAGPGAGDDASGVAVLLESLRALKNESGHPVIALFTDGEEAGLLGASFFLADEAMRARVGVVVNVEARGTSGPSYLFQTSAKDSALIDIYARIAKRPATSSLYGEIYKYLPNDTDLTPFLKAGFAGYNFAFIGGSANYHTPRDTIQNLSRGSLQSQGDNVLSLARALRGTEFSALKGEGAIYFDVLGFVPRLPASFALPLALLAFGALALAAWRDQRHGFGALLAPPLFLLGAVGIGFGLHGLAALVSGNPDPSFAYPAYLRVSLMFGVWAALLAAARWGGGSCAWLWLAGFGIAAAIFAPGLSPYFIFPSLLAAALLLLTIKSGRGAALLLAALGAMIVWIGLCARAESIMGLSAHFLFTVPAALGLMTLLPLLRDAPRQQSALLSAGLALGLGLLAGLQPAYSLDAPQRLNVRHVEKDGKAWLLADPVAHLPEDMREGFSKLPEPLLAWRGYVKAMGNSRLPAPSASVTRQENRLTLDLHGSKSASAMMLMLPDTVTAVAVDGVRVVREGGQGVLRCAACASAQVMLEFSGSLPASLMLVEERVGVAMAPSRPEWAVASGQGDVTDIAVDVSLPVFRLGGLGLKEGFPLSQFHSLLMDAGWRPMQFVKRMADGTPENTYGTAGEIFHAGFTGVETCTGTGLNYCYFNYSKEGQCIRVLARGEYRKGAFEPTLVRFEFKCPDRLN